MVADTYVDQLMEDSKIHRFTHIHETNRKRSAKQNVEKFMYTSTDR
jgi:hypothetical protein